MYVGVVDYADESPISTLCIDYMLMVLVFMFITYHVHASRCYGHAGVSVHFGDTR